MPADTEEMPVLETLAAMTAASIERCDLPADTLLSVRLAALVAVDAPATSYLAHIGAAVETGVTIDDAQNVLVVVAPIVGTARVMSAAVRIAEALGLAIVAFEYDAE